MWTPGREFLALYRFDAQDRLLNARIEDLDTRDDLDLEATRGLRLIWLADLDRVHFSPIKVQPFQLERFGTLLGLVP